jgi:alpha/beta superfamily hydrolase
MSNPDTIRADIEETRRNLGTDVDALADKVSPSSIAHRQADRVKGRFRSVQESLMGTVRTAQDKVGSAGGGVAGGAGSAKDTVADAAYSTTEAAKGHPVVVGLIAFGAGWLISSLLPTTQGEQQLAVRAKEAAAPLTDKVKEVAKDAGQEVAQNLKEPAQDAAQHVKGTATDAAQTVKQEGQSAAGDVKSSAADAKDTVQGQASDAKDQLQSQAQGAKDDLQSQRS